MPVLNDISPRVEERAFRRALRFADDEQGRAAASDILSAAIPLLEPRVYFRDSFVDERSDGTVTIDGRTFHSRVLRSNLESIERVFPYVLTMGGRLEKAAAAQDDLFRQYAFETVADMALADAGARFESQIRRLFGVGALSAMSPGSLEDWPIEEQAILFDLLGETEARIGVRLSDSMLMVPRKSVSGILFASEESFTSCALCPRRSCHGRRAAYEPAKRAAFGLEDGS